MRFPIINAESVTRNEWDCTWFVWVTLTACRSSQCQSQSFRIKCSTNQTGASVRWTKWASNSILSHECWLLTAAVTIKIANQKTQKSYRISWLNYFICFSIYCYCKCHFNCNHDSPPPSGNYFLLTEENRRNSSPDNNRSRDFDVLDNC